MTVRTLVNVTAGGAYLVGTLYLDTFENALPPNFTVFNGDEVAALKYTYTIG